MTSTPVLNVVVVGGGVGAVETVLALHDLAADRIDLTLVARERDFELRALSTAEPFAADHVRGHSLAELAARVGARLIVDEVTGVDADRHAVRLGSGDALGYDALVLAVGARQETAFRRALTFTGQAHSTAYNGLLADLEEGWSHSIAFVVPPGVTWPLPLYELALMTAADVRGMGIDGVALELVTPEEAPLALFGPTASAGIAQLLAEAGITFRGGVYATAGPDHRLTVLPGGEALDAERVVALPTLAGPQLIGVPSDDRGFIPVDDACRVRDRPDVYAAGDGTTFPVKQGGIACQMADAIAQQLARRAGAVVDPEPFRPVLRGRLLTPAGAQALEHPLTGGHGDGEAPVLRLWSPAHKVEGRYLSAWLQEREEPTVAPVADPQPGVPVDVPLLNDWQAGRLAMRLDPYTPTRS